MRGSSFLEVTAPQSPVVEVSVADVLTRAADLLEEFGWRQGDYGSKREGTFCMLGAVDAACGDLGANFHNDGVCLALYKSFEDASVVKWNDAPGRTKAEVVAKLRDAAARLDRVVVERANKTGPADGRVRSGGRTE